MRKNIELSQLGAVKSYINRKLLPLLGQHSGNADLTVLSRGKRGPVVLCKGDQGGYVVKMYGSPRRFFNAKKAHEYFSRHDIPCARILHTGICLDMRAGPGKFILVQEEIRGPRIDEVEDRDEAIIQIARTLAFMHGHTRTTPGPFYRPPNWRILYSPWFRLFPWEQERKPKTIFDSRFETSIRRLDELQQRGGLTAIEARGVTHSMEKARSPIVQDDCYQLIHGDFGPSQVILQDGIPILIDLDTAMFGNFTYELVRAQQTLCRSDRERQLLQDSYFAEAGHGSQDLFNEAKFFFELTYHLGRANHCLKRSIKKNEEDGASHFRQRYQFHKEQLLSFVS